MPSAMEWLNTDEYREARYRVFRAMDHFGDCRSIGQLAAFVGVSEFDARKARAEWIISRRGNPAPPATSVSYS